MSDYSEIAAGFVAHVSESLSREVKRWIDPTTPHSQAIFVKTCFAMRNHNGGHLLIGFDDGTLQPDSNNIPNNVREVFHPDKIQELIARYASEPFEVFLDYPVFNGQEYPVISIPSGVKTPVFTKRPLKGNDGGEFFSEHCLFVRTLNSNHIPSTAPATWRDWPALMDRCFDNREADIGRFVRRHLAGIDARALQETFGQAGGLFYLTSKPIEKQLLENAIKRFRRSVEEQLGIGPNVGYWSVSACVEGIRTDHHEANEAFLNLLMNNRRDYSGWPTWIDMRYFPNGQRPNVINNAWEGFHCHFNNEVDWLNNIDYWIIDPMSRFVLVQAFREDMRVDADITPGEIFDFDIPVSNVAEAIATIFDFVETLGWDKKNSNVRLLFRWTGLENRALIPWINRRRWFRQAKNAKQNEVESTITIPLEVAREALSTYVRQAVLPLYRAFEGYEISEEIVDQIVRGVLKI